MDDKEYYSLMNRSTSWQLTQALKKKGQPKQPPQDKKNASPLASQTYTSLELRQGKADAEMLIEKQLEP